MSVEDLARAYERLLRREFSPQVVCRVHARYSPEEDPFLDVLCIPDERRSEFVEFSLDVLPDLLEEVGLPDATLVPYGEAESREHFPQHCRQAPTRGETLPHWASTFRSLCSGLVAPLSLQGSSLVSGLRVQIHETVQSVLAGAWKSLADAYPDLTSYWASNCQLGGVEADRDSRRTHENTAGAAESATDETTQYAKAA